MLKEVEFDDFQKMSDFISQNVDESEIISINKMASLDGGVKYTLYYFEW